MLYVNAAEIDVDKETGNYLLVGNANSKIQEILTKFGMGKFKIKATNLERNPTHNDYTAFKKQGQCHTTYKQLYKVSCPECKLDKVLAFLSNRKLRNKHGIFLKDVDLTMHFA